MGLIKSLLFNERAPKAAKRAIILNGQRAAVSAANVSNAETPGYNALKFVFESSLQDAVSGDAFPMRATNIRHITSPAGDISAIQGITDVDLSHTRTAVSRAELANRMTKNAQQKTVDAYQEILRTSV